MTDLFSFLDSAAERDRESATVADGKSTQRGGAEIFASGAAALQLSALLLKALSLWKVL